MYATLDFILYKTTVEETHMENHTSGFGLSQQALFDVTRMQRLYTNKFELIHIKPCATIIYLYPTQRLTEQNRHLTRG